MKKATIFLSSLLFLSIINIAHGEDEIIIDFSNPDSVWDAIKDTTDYKRLVRSDFPVGKNMCKNWSYSLGGDREKSGMVAEYDMGMHLKVICYGNMVLEFESARNACTSVLKRHFISVDRYILRCGKLLHQPLKIIER